VLLSLLYFYSKEKYFLEKEEGLSIDAGKRGEYSSWIHGVMKKPANLQKQGLKEPVRVVFASSPPFGPVSNILLHSQDRKYPEFSSSLELIRSVVF
jgi:hypothetical protein